MSYSNEVAHRFREVVDQHGGPSAFARLIGKSPQTLTDYLAGKTLPGNKLRAAIREKLGDELEYYIMNGTREERDARHVKNAETIFRNSGSDKAKMLDVIEKHGILTAEQLDRILEARSMMLVEPKLRYNPKAKKK